MLDKFFFIDVEFNIYKTYQDLFNELSELKRYNKYCYTSSTYEVFKYILYSVLIDREIVLLDADFSEEELQGLGVDLNSVKESEIIDASDFSVDSLKDIEESLNKWSITIFTSGTTGLPKKVIHTYHSITKAIKISDKRRDNIWGLAYNPTHMAGLQVFFQALLNSNTIVNIFKKSNNIIDISILKYLISNISSTPTYLGLLTGLKGDYPSVKRLTTGGEKIANSILLNLKSIFPNAKYLNVYASTEAGAIFASNGDIFTIKDSSTVRIDNNELFIHRKLLGTIDESLLIDDWYNTNDIVDVVDFDPVRFRFVSRKNEMINVGGYKVNPSEVENIINSIPQIYISRVYGRENSVLGNILCVDVLLKEQQQISILEIKKFLKLRIQDFKIPRIIDFVSEIDTTRTGKIKR